MVVNMGKRRDHLLRYIGLGAIFICGCLIFIARLVSIQIAGQDYYTETTGEKTYTRTLTIQAQRGEIFDRNGVALVTNSYTYDLYLDAGSLSRDNEKRNALILDTLTKAEQLGGAGKTVQPENPFVQKDGSWELVADYMDTVYGRRLTKLMTGLNFKQNEDGTWKDTDIGQVRDALLYRYGLVDEDGKSLYSEESSEKLFALRLDMEMHNFSESEPYKLLEDVDVKLLSALYEGSVRGLYVKCEAKREYAFPGYASHILGRLGRIQEKDAEYYTEQGYSLDATVGTSGVEKAFEEYLHGTDGELTVVEDKYGNVVDQYVSREPVAGQNVYLTIDINLQMDAEKALANNIQLIVENAEAKDDELVGEDARSGALTAISAKTGEVRALASYPTYNLATFDEDYKSLTENEDSPLFNRALEGTYAPGSTFKPGIAAAALQEGIITPTSEIKDEGQYTYYDDFQPSCWIYAARYGYQTHGYVNVSQAIQVSCNYFFYEMGRRLTITTMNKYCARYGLGQATGIELAEKTGVLAGPAEREAEGRNWYDGDSLAAAIGQSDNLFNPLQISVYISTLLNGGNRLGAHILYQLRDFDGNITYQSEPKVVDSIELSDTVVSTVRYAMKDVTENGSAARVFSDFPISMGGKTGTAQVSKTSSDNAVFTAFAPFDDTDIVATCIIEHGANGTDAGFAVRDLFNSYFGLNNNGDNGAAENGGGNEG